MTSDRNLNPPVGISHVTRSITDLYAHRVGGADVVTLRSAAQLNAYPHLGTVFTLGCAFALSEQLRRDLNVRVQMEFWSLENAPATVRQTEHGSYYLPLFEAQANDDSGKSVSELHEPLFETVLQHFSAITGTPVTMLSYRDFQARRETRVQMRRLLDNGSRLEHLLTPSERHLKLRFPCPKCQWTPKLGATSIDSASESELTASSVCYEHGSYTNVLSPDNDDYFDTNTPVRALIREIQTVHESLAEPRRQSIFCDGSDWAHFGDINAQALWTLGEPVHAAPLRFFAPAIIDETGAKLSKSAQVGTDAYDHLEQFFVDADALVQRYGLGALTRVMDETRTWITDTKRIFRSYTLNRIENVVTGGSA